ncbi:unnamed protein product [Phytophthora lilii]|uniref:Unnamed protein product n=1 Tax=Phytophthora lilii TaxID=2077276 RepID=A0A9W6TPC3_9STRA|nr:unnamed protein product [Phytophthora lilii]
MPSHVVLKWHAPGAACTMKTDALPIEVQLIGGFVVGTRDARAKWIRRTLEAERAAEKAVALTASATAHAISAARRALARVVDRSERTLSGSEVRLARDVLDAHRAEQPLLRSSGFTQVENAMLLGAVLADCLMTMVNRIDVNAATKHCFAIIE